MPILALSIVYGQEQMATMIFEISLVRSKKGNGAIEDF